MKVSIENTKRCDRVAYLVEGQAFTIKGEEIPYIYAGFDDSTYHASLLRVTETGLVLETYPFSEFRDWTIEPLEITSISLKRID